MGLQQKILDADIANQRSRWREISQTPRIQELLDPEFTGDKFQISTAKETLEKSIGDAQIMMAIGGYFGDESKGTIGNMLAEYCVASFRLNSGENTGRTIYLPDGTKIKLNVNPTSIALGMPSFVGPNTTLDPVGMFERELKGQLIDNGIEYLDKLFYGNHFLTLPHHRAMDVLGSKNNSSTGVGIKYAHESIVARRAVRLDDIFGHSDTLRDKIKGDIRRFSGFTAETGIENPHIKLEEVQQSNPRIVPEHVLKFAQIYQTRGIDAASTYLTDLLIEKVRENPLYPRRTNVRERLLEFLNAGEKVLLEPTQSFFLSNSEEINYEASTSADTSAGGVIAAMGINPGRYKTKVFSVLKLPGASKVGSGDIPGAFTGCDFYAKQGVISSKELGNTCLDFEGISNAYFAAVQENGLIEPTVYECPNTRLKFDIGSAMAISSSREYKEEGATTGKPRITGLIDLVLASYLQRRQSEDVFLTCLDRSDLSGQVGLVVGYVVHLSEDGKFLSDQKGNFIDCNGIKYRTGQIVKPGEEVPNRNILQYCVPIIKVMQGCKETPIGAGNGFRSNEGSLPTNVSKIFEAIEHYSGLKIQGFRNGTDQNDIQYLKRVT